MDLDNMKTRELRMFVERHLGTLDTRIEDCRADADELNEDSSSIDADRVLEDMRSLEGLGNKIVACCKTVVARKNWTPEQLFQDDRVVTQEILEATRAESTEIKAKIKAALKHCGGKIRTHKEEAVRREAIDKLRIQREARQEDETAHPRAPPVPTLQPPAPARVQVFKMSDAPKPDTITVDCDWKIFKENKKKLKQVYDQAQKPDNHTAEAQQQIFLGFLDTALAEEMNVKLLEETDANWERCLALLEEIMETKNPIISRRVNIFEERQNETEATVEFLNRMKIGFRNADIANMSIDDFQVIKIVTGIRDKKLKENLLKIVNPTMAKIEAEIRIYEQAKATTNQLSGSDEARASYSRGRGAGRGNFGNRGGRGRGGAGGGGFGNGTPS